MILLQRFRLNSPRALDSLLGGCLDARAESASEEATGSSALIARGRPPAPTHLEQAFVWLYWGYEAPSKPHESKLRGLAPLEEEIQL